QAIRGSGSDLRWYPPRSPVPCRQSKEPSRPPRCVRAHVTPQLFSFSRGPRQVRLEAVGRSRRRDFEFSLQDAVGAERVRQAAAATTTNAARPQILQVRISISRNSF